MKKKVLAAILCVAMVASMMIGCTTKSPTSGGDDKKDDGKGGKKIGITIQNYENAYWAGVMSKLEQILKDEGYDATIVGCEENSAKQSSRSRTSSLPDVILSWFTQMTLTL